MDLPDTARILTAAAAFTPAIAADDERVVRAWHALIGDLDYQLATEALRDHYRRSSYPITPADIVNGVEAINARSRQVPHHLRCMDHPDLDMIAQHCPHCRRLTADGHRMISPPDSGVIEMVRQIARKAKLETRARERERAAALQARADEAYQRRITAAERDRQKAAYMKENR